MLITGPKALLRGHKDGKKLFTKSSDHTRILLVEGSSTFNTNEIAILLVNYSSLFHSFFFIINGRHLYIVIP